MKTSLLSKIAWALVAALLFIAGYFVGDMKEGKDVRNETTPRASGTAAASAEKGPVAEAIPAKPDDRLAKDATSSAPLTREQTRARTFELLADVNRISRMSRLCDLLTHVTPENWRDVLDAFVRQAGSEGRTFAAEWEMTLERIGEVVGAEAMTAVLSSDESRERGWANWLLVGWSSKDPKAALEWYQTQTPSQQVPLVDYLIRGMSRSDAKEALAIVMTLPADAVQDQAAKVVASTLQRGGFREAEDLLASISSRTDVPDVVKNKVFWSLAQSKIRSGIIEEKPAKALEWFDPYLGQGYIGPYVTRDLVGGAAKADIPGTLGWLEARAARMTPVQADTAFGTVAQVWQGQAPDQFTTWMRTHPDHPQYDSMAGAAATSAMQKGQIAAARQWSDTVHDPQIRATLDQAIQRAQAK